MVSVYGNSNAKCKRIRCIVSAYECPKIPGGRTSVAYSTLIEQSLRGKKGA